MVGGANIFRDLRSERANRPWGTADATLSENDYSLKLHATPRLNVSASGHTRSFNYPVSLPQLPRNFKRGDLRVPQNVNALRPIPAKGWRSPHKLLRYVITPTPRESCKRPASRILICIPPLPSFALRTRSPGSTGLLRHCPIISLGNRRRNEPVMRARADPPRGNISR